MAIKKGKSNQMQEIGLDPAVAIHLQNSAQVAADAIREKETHLTAAQRKKRKKDAERNKVTYDLPKDITNQINTIAAKYGERGIPANQVVAFLLNYALKQYDKKTIDFDSHLKPSIVPRFSFFLDIPEK